MAKKENVTKWEEAPNFWFTSYLTWWEFWKKHGKSEEDIHQLIREEIKKSDKSDEMKEGLLQVFGVKPKETPDQLIDRILNNIFSEEYSLGNAKMKKEEAEKSVLSVKNLLDSNQAQIDAERIRIQPQLDDIDAREKAEIERIRERFNQKRTNVRNQLSHFESERRGLEAIQAQNQECIKATSEKIFLLKQRCDQLYSALKDVENPTIVILDATFTPQDLAIIGYPLYYTSEEEANLNPHLKNLADLVKPKDKDKYEVIKTKPVSEVYGEMVLRVDALATVVIGVFRTPDTDYIVRVGTKMKKYLQPFFKDQKIGFSRKKK